MPLFRHHAFALVMTDFDRPRGTRDFRPEEMARRQAVLDRMRQRLEAFGYGQVQTPTFEHLELFTEKSGEAIVKELYEFEDKSERALTLRPELTASVIRFYNNELIAEPKPLRLWYHGNCFRYERPQKGRFREFWQVGLELIGAQGPQADAEVIAVADSLVQAAKVPSHRLRVGHIGILQLLVDLLPADQPTKQATFPLIDKGDESLGEHLAGTGAAPKLVQAIETIAGFQRTVELTGDPEAVAGRIEQALAPVFEVLETLGLDEEAEDRVARDLAATASTLVHLSSYAIDEVVLDLGVARGLDYYTGVVFEIEADGLGAQDQIVGGGSYTLTEVLGGQPTPTAGFGLGFDRVLLVSELEAEDTGPLVHLAPIGGDAPRFKATEVAAQLREAGLRCTLDINERSPSKNLDFADKHAIPYVILLGSNELEDGVATIKEMATGDQEQVPFDELVDHLANRATDGSR